MSCLICNSKNNEEIINYDRGVTMHSLTPVKEYFQKIIGCSLKIETENDEMICIKCYDSLNELDELELKTNKIKEDLKNKYNLSKKIIISSMDNKILSVLTVNNIEDHKQENIIEIETDLSHIDSEEVGKKPCRIHFNNKNDLKNILGSKLKDATNTDNATIDDVLYDMMNGENLNLPMSSNKEKIIKKQQYSCKKCDDTFDSQSEYKLHLSKHNEDKPFICEICGKVYRHKTALNIHLGMHKGINPFECLYCNKTFTQKGALMRHVKIHTGEKSYQCEECGKCFTHHTSFNIHKKSHTGEKSYKCDVCGLKFMSTSHLKRHMRVHTGEKKYPCLICGKRFAERYNLASHQKLHNIDRILTPKKRFKCDICNTSFVKRTNLDEHLKEHSSSDIQYIS